MTDVHLLGSGDVADVHMFPDKDASLKLSALGKSASQLGGIWILLLALREILLAMTLNIHVIMFSP